MPSLHTTKTASTARKHHSTSPPSSSSSSSKSASPFPLSKQVRALERARASTQQALASETSRAATLTRTVDELTAKLAAAHASAARASRNAAILLADHQRALEGKAALARQLAESRRRARDDAARRRALEARLAREARESWVHRCAARVAYDLCESESGRAELLEILRRCEEMYAAKGAPPQEEGEEEEEEETPAPAACTTPKRRPQSPLTPVSMRRAPEWVEQEVLDDDSDDSGDSEWTPTKREGPRSKRRRLVSRGSPRAAGSA